MTNPMNNDKYQLTHAGDIFVKPEPKSPPADRWAAYREREEQIRREAKAEGEATGALRIILGIVAALLCFAFASEFPNALAQFLWLIFSIPAAWFGIDRMLAKR
jgi:hypothetical protein